MADRKKGGTSSKGGQRGRGLHQGVKTARGRKSSSTRWIQRQINDPYVRAANEEGYRSRAAYKLTELDEKFNLLKPGQNVLDLGAAPGAWSQVAEARCGAGAIVVAVDLSEMEPLKGVTILTLDVTVPDSLELMKTALGGEADVVLCDMAPKSTGHKGTDHVRIVGLAEAAAEVAIELLRPGGAFVAKVFQGGTEGELLTVLKQSFSRVRHAKPGASRKESAETYVVATGFRGPARESQV